MGEWTIQDVLEGRSSWAVAVGDCLEVLPTIPSGSVDCFLTDPPWGIDFQSARRIESQRFDKIANDKTPAVEWLPSAFASTREGGCLLCFCRWDTSEAFRAAIEAAGFVLRSQVIWDRVVHGMGDLEASFAPRHDTIWFATKGAYSFPGKRPASVIAFDRVPADDLVHPNEKPVDLLTYLIEATTIPDALVADPFMGSGSCGSAAGGCGRRFWGCEIDEHYAAIARRRIAEAANTLWTPAAPKHEQVEMFKEQA